MFRKMISKIIYKEVSRYVDLKFKNAKQAKNANEAIRRYEDEQRQKELKLQSRVVEFAEKISIVDKYLNEEVHLEQVLEAKMDNIHDFFENTWWSKNSIEKEHYPYPKSCGSIFLTTPQFTGLVQNLNILRQYELASYMSESQKATVIFIVSHSDILKRMNKRLLNENYQIKRVTLYGPTLTFHIDLIKFH